MNNTATADDSERPAGSRPPPDVQQPAEPSQTPQLDRSRLLNSEGLEGLIPRASLLLRTGGTFFLGFLPFILLASLLFVGMYFVRPCPGSAGMHTLATRVAQRTQLQRRRTHWCIACVANSVPREQRAARALQAFGEQFIHSGTTSTSLPGFVDPYDLLAEPTVDPYYPIN